MVRVKLVKIDAEDMWMATDEQKNRIGEIFEAFEINDEYAEKEKCKKQYALNLHKYIWFVPAEWCEVVEGLTTMENNSKDETHKIKSSSRILLVEDGSVDVDHIENDLGIPCIVCRQGSKKPEWL